MADAPTTWDLVRERAITAADIDALITAYEASSGAGPLPLGEAYRLDVEAAVDAHPPAARSFNDPAVEDAQRWTMIWEAILLARPEKG